MSHSLDRHCMCVFSKCHNAQTNFKFYFGLSECQSGPIACPPAVCGDGNVTNSEGPLLLSPDGPVPLAQPLSTQPFVESVYNALNCQENDYAALFSLCLLYALGKNKGMIIISQWSS